MTQTTVKIIDILNQDKEPVGVVGSPSDTFEAIVDIRDVSEKSKLLGELVCFTVQESDSTIFVLGQITEIKTVNRWHEEPSFKGIIKRHGSLPNLSGISDNRIAKINVQSSFKLKEQDNIPKAHKLANSPSTGESVKKVNNEIMRELVKQYKKQLVCIGRAYDTDVNVPFWFKHFGKAKDDNGEDANGAGDAYHIGVFGRTGSGKTTTAANMILGYAKNHKHMSILILDPQEQFYEDNNVLPNGVKFKDKIKKLGMKYKRYQVPREIALSNNSTLFSQLLLDYGFVRKAFWITTKDKQILMAESIAEYISGRMFKPSFNIGGDNDNLLDSMLNGFLKSKKYLNNVYAAQGVSKLSGIIKSIVDGSESINEEAKQIWNNVCNLFLEEGKTKLSDIVKSVVNDSGNAVILNISGRKSEHGMESIQTLFVKIIEDAIKEKGAELYANGKQSNCLVVLDEAHRFISDDAYNDDIKQLTTSIIDAVRTTRKYGIGYMFITQTIESLHKKIREQIRIFAFGYGLTSGTEFAKIKDIINDDTGAKFYRSFIDPSSNQKFPFMFYGPISPLSFTGAPLFLEMDGLISEFENS